MTLSTRALAVVGAVALALAQAATSNLRGWKDDDHPMHEACHADCASLHRTTVRCEPLANGSATAWCGACLPGFYGNNSAATVPCAVNETYWDAGNYGGYGDDDSYDHSGGSSSRMGMQAAIGSAFGSFVVVLMCVITWRGWLDCCSRKRAREPLRAFLEPTTKEWACAVCLHTNSSLRRFCVLCKSEFRDKGVDTEASTATQHEEKVSSSLQTDSNVYVMIETPRGKARSAGGFAAAARRDDEEWTEEKRAATERLEWKRCLDKRTMRWVRFRADDVRRIPALRGALVRVKDLSSLEMFRVGGVQSTAPVDGFFVLQEKQAVTVWHPVEQAVFSSHPYKQWRSLQNIASLPFDDRLRWFHQQLLKLRHMMRDELFTIHVHRDRVLKQTVQIFQVTPPVTLRRHLRVDFMDEPGIDGGGILREWLQLVCKELFAETLGLFKRTASSVDGGYWIHRTATRKSNSELQMYRFFGMFLAKALLEGLVVNVRLATPLLKHLLGSPLSREDLRFLDDQIYASVNYILANDHTDELSLTFSVADRDLISNGAEIAVTDANKHKYVELLVQYYLFDSVEDELSGIHDGFRSVLPTTPLHAFDHKELDLVLSGLAEIDVLDWQAHTNVGMLGHDAAQEQQIVDWFWEVVDDFDQRKRSRLLQYVTGSSGVPVEGFAALTSLDGTLQPFTIQLVDIAAKTYSTLPYASTCFNRLDLPVYETKRDLEQTLMLMVETDCTGFNRR